MKSIDISELPNVEYISNILTTMCIYTPSYN